MPFLTVHANPAVVGEEAARRPKVTFEFDHMDRASPEEPRIVGVHGSGRLVDTYRDLWAQGVVDNWTHFMTRVIGGMGMNVFYYYDELPEDPGRGMEPVAKEEEETTLEADGEISKVDEDR